MNRVPTDIDCPQCQTRTRTLVPGIGNKLKYGLYVITWSLLGFQLTSVRWQCQRCNHKFSGHSFHDHKRFG